MSYDLQFFYVWQNLDKLGQGLVVSLELTGLANLIGLTLGFGVALLLGAKSALLRAPAAAMVEVFRCTPVLVQVVWFFYCVPILFNLFIDPMVMGVLALGVNLAAFNAEGYRAAIQSVPREQYDACAALGLTGWTRIRHVILPHALRAALPVLMTNGITIFQQSALVALVAIPDLMYAGKMLATETYRPIETYTVVAAIYFAISAPVSLIVQRIEARFDRVQA
ncbi:amino acid ABC transporter membrane protein 1 (PAAT family) [Rhodobacter sp. 140A]|uniref:L-cystine transport system permease protein YecS n=1 Tax=bioreactor metagenome TaxID=1076179 RepID=A0A644W0P0_9ZZZZ|nr:amino acid ABC transporter membrane protein 1 (PAAT family) [Rhodobacter sp. 140A]